MKPFPLYILFLFLAVTSAGATPEPISTRVPDISVIGPRNSLPMPAPLANYWDSNSWEADSGTTFWHKANGSGSNLSPTTPHPAKAPETIPGKNTRQTETGKN